MVHEHESERSAQQSYQTREKIIRLYSRTGRPPLENPALGDQAILDPGREGERVKVTVVVRKGIRLVEVQYATPPGVPVAAKPGAEQVAAALLAI